MKILIVHPVMSFLGGGERLCCETTRALSSLGHEVTIVSESFSPKYVERYFGFDGLFDSVELIMYPGRKQPPVLGSPSHLIHAINGQARALNRASRYRKKYDLVFSTQDPGYIPDFNLPVVQWGYFPRIFPNYSPRSIAKIASTIPLRIHYRWKIARIGLVLAISKFSKSNLDREWRRPSVLVYPACKMISPGKKRDLIITVARAIPVKKLELFWEVARQRPKYEFIMLVTQDPEFASYGSMLQKEAPENGRMILNPSKELYDKVLGEAKVYLHMMKGEHFGITIVEAMSALCVPVVHDSGGPREIVTDGIGFRWRNVDDIPGMVDIAIENSPSLRARQRAEDFTVERFEKSLSSVFSGLRA